MSLIYCPTCGRPAPDTEIRSYQATMRVMQAEIDGLRERAETAEKALNEGGVSKTIAEENARMRAVIEKVVEAVDGFIEYNDEF